MRRCYACELCKGRGWTCVPRVGRIPDSGEWPVSCTACRGVGRLTTGQVARRLGEYHATIDRVEHGNVGARVGARVLSKLVSSGMVCS